MNQFEREFDEVRSQRLARENAEIRRRETIKQAEIEAARKCIQTIVDEFGSDERYGGSLKPQMPNLAERTNSPDFQFMMLGSRVDLLFSGRTQFKGSEVPEGVSALSGVGTELRVTAQTKASDQQAAMKTSDERSIQVRFEPNGACIVSGLYYAASRAAAELA